MVIFDTNMILRYLLNDNEEMADQAERYLDTGNVLVTIAVIAEVVYVMKGVYAMDRGEITDTIKGFLKLVSCQERDVLNRALDAYRGYNLDFVDCVLYAYHIEKGFEIATFDKKLLHILQK